MRYTIFFILVSALILSAAGYAGGQDSEQFTRIPFSIRGPYVGDAEIFQFESVRYFKAIKQKTDVSAEYETALPAVFESVPFNVRTGSVSRTLDARRMDIISGVDPEISRLFGKVKIESSVRVKAVAVAVLYLLCIVILLRSGLDARRAALLVAATLLFSIAEVLLLEHGVKKISVALHEGKTNGTPYSYEFVGVGCPFERTAEFERKSGVLFPVHETIQDLLGDELRIQITEKGSSVKDVPLERGKYRVFCCMSPGGLGGEIAVRGNQVINLTGVDMTKAFLWREKQVFVLGGLSSGGRSDLRNARTILRNNVIEEAGGQLDPVALKLLSWRLKRLGSVDVVFGFVSSSRILFFEIGRSDGPQ